MQRIDDIQNIAKADRADLVDELREEVDPLRGYICNISQNILEKDEELQEIKQDIEELRDSMTTSQKDIQASKQQLNFASALQAGAICLWGGFNYFKQPQKNGDDLKKNIPTD